MALQCATGDTRMATARMHVSSDFPGRGDSMRIALLLAVVLVTWVTPPIFSADDSPAIEVNPVGEPKGLSRGDAVRYFLWHDAEGWHLRTDSNGKPHRFQGRIDVVAGKVTTISDFENLEPGRNRRRADLGILN